MQRLLSIITLLLSIRCVSAANEIRVIFNNGLPPSKGSSCSETEHAKIDAVFTQRRYLRNNDISPSSTNETSLPSSVGTRSVTSIRICANICIYYYPRTCRKYGCLAFRELSSGDPNLGLSCPDEIKAIQEKLNDIQNKATASCQRFMDFESRRVKCYPDYQYGKVEGLRVWKKNSTGLYTYRNFIEPDRHFFVCNNVNLNFGSLNEPCVETATLRLTGPNNYYHERVERQPPYTLFGDIDTNLNSRKFDQTGVYHLTITPDRDETKTTKFSFMVKDCTS